MNLTPQQINYRQFTHLCHAFATTTPEGTLSGEGGVPDKELTTLAHAQGVKVLLVLGGAGSGKIFDALLRDTAATERYLTAVIEMVRTYDYDGIDLDWEYPKEDHGRDGFNYLIKQFRQRLDAQKPGLLVTAALGSSATCRAVDLEPVKDSMDFLNVMTYDIHGPWEDHAGFNAPLDFDPNDKPGCSNYTVKTTMAFWAEQKKWPKNRLVVGIPSYGRGFVADQWFGSIQKGEKLDVGSLNFKNIQALLADGWVRHWNEKASVPWLSKPGVKGLITYDDEQSVAAKAKWVRQNGYRGVFFWEIFQDFVDGKHVLVKAAADAYNSTR